jgi:hypothetical protein
LEDSNRIKFALHLENWDYDTGDKKHLRNHAIQVTTMEYALDMKGCIFCPECCVGLFRSPEDRNYDAAGRKAYFAHGRKHTPNCSLRVKKAEGKKFENEEQAKQAIENEELVIVKGFMKEKPLPLDINGPIEYQGDPIEDQDGGVSEVPIGRHNGDEFKLPSRVTTIRGLCRNFDKNLHRYFFLPHQDNVRILQDLLVNVNTVTATCDDPKMYFGKVTKSWNWGKTRKNIRQTMLEYTPNNEWPDFCLKAIDEDSQEHGIDNDSTGKIVLMYGKITVSGVGLCIEHLGWGEFAVLPQKYAHLLYESA